MLDTIKDFFLSVGDIITSIVGFYIGLIEDIVYVVKLTAAFAGKIPLLFGWLPAEAVAIIVVIFVVVVIYKVLGREG